MDFLELLAIYNALVTAGNTKLAAKIEWVKSAHPRIMSTTPSPREAFGWSLESVIERTRQMLSFVPFVYDDGFYLVAEKGVYRCVVRNYFDDDRERYDCGHSRVSVEFYSAQWVKREVVRKRYSSSNVLVAAKKGDAGAFLEWSRVEASDLGIDDAEYHYDIDYESKELVRVVKDWWRVANS